MQWFRRHARQAAAAALVSLVAMGGLSPLAHGSECHDDECVAIVLPHDPASHAVRTGSGSAAGSAPHCILCHTSRVTRPTADTASRLHRPSTEVTLLKAEVLGTPVPAQVSQPPLRSPPLS
jgi:hypothetical protein